MFDRIIAPPRSTLSRSGAFIGISAGVHVAAALALTIAGMWPIEKLSPPDRQVVLALPFIPPPPQIEERAARSTDTPPPARAGAAVPRRRTTVRHTPAASEVETAATFGDHHGSAPVENGSGDGSGGFGRGLDGHGQGFELDLLHLAPLKAPPLPPAPRMVPARILDGRRIAGNAQILPSPTVRASMTRAAQDTLRVPVQMCLTSSGTVRSLELIESSGHGEYDRAILDEMQHWRYDPYRVNGAPSPVCTVITFIYRMQ